MADDIDVRLNRIEAGLAEIKATLALLVPMLTGIDDRMRSLEAGQAEMRGEMRGQLAQIGQRISDVNARLPVPIAYSPSKPAAE